MPLSPTPDLGSSRRLAGATLVVTLCVWALLAWSQGDITKTLGDTDDAMRLVRVHDLMAGQGWFDQRITRLQPPLGTMMHWSRLLDGALAAVDWSFARVTSAATADWALRFVWPLLWIGPAVFCGLTMARSLLPPGAGRRSAVLIAPVLLFLDLQLYSQFRPGRIDHHNVQIVMTLIVAASAMASKNRARWAGVAGAATGLGLAIGIEALAFHAVIGASFALRAAFEPREARTARTYGVALVAASLGLFLIQTPPSLWSSPVCDALGSNLVLAIALGGLGLAAATSLTGKVPLMVRLGLLGLMGFVAAGAYLAADPACLHGPFAAVDPRLRPFWFDRIQELRSWPQMWRLDRDVTIASITMVAMAVIAAIVLIARRGREPATLLAAALVALAGLAASQAFRMNDYIFWFGAPVVAAAIALLVVRWQGGALIATLLAGVLLSPATVTMAATQLAHLAPAPVKTAIKANAAAQRCLNTRAYAPLASLPPGVVLAPIDLGPFILAHTASSALAAPYHRMSWGILAAHDALNAPATTAQAQVRRLNVRYIVDCPGDLSDPPAASLMDNLRRSHVPAWLKPLSSRGQALQIYQVVAAAPDPH